MPRFSNCRFPVVMRSSVITGLLSVSDRCNLCHVICQVKNYPLYISFSEKASHRQDSHVGHPADLSNSSNIVANRQTEINYARGLNLYTPSSPDRDTATVCIVISSTSSPVLIGRHENGLRKIQQLASGLRRRSGWRH